MKARYLGFNWGVGPAVSVEEVFASLAKRGSISVAADADDNPGLTFRGHRRLFCWHQRGDVLLGALVTLKGQRAFTQLERVADELVVQVRNVGKESRLMELNVVALHRLTRRGIYLYYHGSCSVGEFSELVKREHSQIFRGKHRQNSSLTRHDGHFGWGVETRMQDAAERIRELNSVRAIEVTVTNLDDSAFNEWSDVPLGENIQSVKYTVNLEPSPSVTNKVASWFRDVRRSLGSDLRSARVEGKDHHDNKTRIDMLNDLVTFDEIDFDDLSRMLNFKLSEFEASRIAEMVAEMAGRAGLSSQLTR